MPNTQCKRWFIDFLFEQKSKSQALTFRQLEEPAKLILKVETIISSRSFYSIMKIHRVKKNPCL